MNPKRDTELWMPEVMTATRNQTQRPKYAKDCQPPLELEEERISGGCGGKRGSEVLWAPRSILLAPETEGSHIAIALLIQL